MALSEVTRYPRLDVTEAAEMLHYLGGLGVAVAKVRVQCPGWDSNPHAPWGRRV